MMAAGSSAPTYMSPTERPSWSAMTMRTREGGTIWADNLCIPTSAPSQYTAEVFINYLMRPEIAAANSNFAWYGTPIPAAHEFIDEEVLNEPAIYPPDEVMARLEWLEDVGDATPLYERLWTEVRAAGP